jgi:hypothetical protein
MRRADTAVPAQYRHTEEQRGGRNNAVGKIGQVLPGNFLHLERDTLVERHVPEDCLRVGGSGVQIVQAFGGIRPFSMR